MKLYTLKYLYYINHEVLRRINIIQLSEKSNYLCRDRGLYIPDFSFIHLIREKFYSLH